MEEQESVDVWDAKILHQKPKILVRGKQEDVGQLFYNLAVAQSNFEGALKSTSGHGYKYADLEAVWDSIGQPLNNQEIFVSCFATEVTDEYVSISTFIAGHGAMIEYPPLSVPLPPENPRMNGPQRVGATITYARRYALETIFCLSRSEDTDVSTNQPAISLSPQAIAEKYNIPLPEALRLGKESRATGKSIDELISNGDDEINLAEESSE